MREDVSHEDGRGRRRIRKKFTSAFADIAASSSSASRRAARVSLSCLVVDSVSFPTFDAEAARLEDEEEAAGEPPPNPRAESPAAAAPTPTATAHFAKLRRRAGARVARVLPALAT